MAVKLFVGGLAWATTEQSLYDTFSAFGQVESAIVIKDRETGRSRGFGFVTYESDEEAQAAIDALNERELDGRNIKVDRAADRGDRPPRQSFRPRGGYEGGNGGYSSNDRDSSQYPSYRESNFQQRSYQSGGNGGSGSGYNDYQQGGGY
ncbi:hypothetical protein BDF14DRAFT_1844184 [Spinellus fusiger]|nr:hypothetical protein BDF14DRAFT_1844184 [Spinellus fusiger]